jgi:hypothetical protein
MLMMTRPTKPAICHCQVCRGFDEVDDLITRKGVPVEDAARLVAEQHDGLAIEGFINAVIERQTGAHRVRRTATA